MGMDLKWERYHFYFLLIPELRIFSIYFPPNTHNQGRN